MHGGGGPAVHRGVRRGSDREANDAVEVIEEMLKLVAQVHLYLGFLIRPFMRFFYYTYIDWEDRRVRRRVVSRSGENRSLSSALHLSLILGSALGQYVALYEQRIN